MMALVLFFAGTLLKAQAQQTNWQANKTILAPSQIEGYIQPVCSPIDARLARDGHSCYILQRQCWMDNSGYAACVVKNCKYAAALDSAAPNAVPMNPLVYNWYCDLTYDPNGASPPGPAIVPPADCSLLGEAWKHRISTDPACAPR